MRMHSNFVEVYIANNQRVRARSVDGARNLGRNSFDQQMNSNKNDENDFIESLVFLKLKEAL